MINGIINVYKEAGYTSFDVVAKMRGIAGQRKIGHTGTLDPEATGVLPLVLGSATKLVDMLTDKKKEYIATFELGKETDTQDIWGNLISEKEVDITETQFREAVLSFIGDIRQIPPMYSALKVDGKKLYELAREGKEVERKARPVTIHDIEIIEMDNKTAKIRIQCSKGTYIRTLCHDIGKKLGCGAVMTSLLRTKSGNFNLEDAYRLDELQALKEKGELDKVVIPVDSIFEEYAKAVVDGEILKKVKNGNMIYINQMKKTLSDVGKRNRIRIYDIEGRFLAIYEKDAEKGVYSVWQMFLNE